MPNPLSIREPAKYYLVDFFRKGGGYPPILLCCFGQNDFLRRKYSDETQVMLISALLGHFMAKIFGDFSLRGKEVGYPLSGKNPLNSILVLLPP